MSCKTQNKERKKGRKEEEGLENQFRISLIAHIRITIQSLSSTSSALLLLTVCAAFNTNRGLRPTLRRMEHNILESIIDRSMEPRDLPFSLLEQITGNFSEDRILGWGGFGVVYKGVVQNGEVAVKRITNSMAMIDEELFLQELIVLMQVDHENIVRFLGYCSNITHKYMKNEGAYILAEIRQRLLCFEYISNGSLEKYITDEPRELEWNTRYNIIKGICKGLKYLHVERRIIHMNLKPANILLDNDMTPKICDFVLAQMDSQTTITNRAFSLRYCAPEYCDGKISVKYDVYSLGIIIIELVTGHRDIFDKDTVLKRWRHIWNKSGQETPFRYQQEAKLIEIGLLCIDNDPYKRPFISKIICDINELESTNRQISNADKYTVEQISPYLDDDILGIEPLKLHFPFKPNKETSCSLQLTNDTNAYIAFCIERTSVLPYCVEPTKGIVAPQSKCSVNITLQPLDKPPQYKQHTSDFFVRSTKLNESITSEEITRDTFHEKEGKVVGEVNLTVVHEPCEPHVDLPLGASNVLAEAESKAGLQPAKLHLAHSGPDLATSAGRSPRSLPRAPCGPAASDDHHGLTPPGPSAAKS